MLRNFIFQSSIIPLFLGISYNNNMSPLPFEQSIVFTVTLMFGLFFFENIVGNIFFSQKNFFHADAEL